MALQTETKTGRVKWFNGRRGYGFITDLDSSKDVFVHHSGLNVSKECWKSLYLGEYVEYSLTEGDDGKSQAVQVTGVRSGPLMCEELASNQEQREEQGGGGSYQRRRAPFSGRGRGGRRFGGGGGRRMSGGRSGGDGEVVSGSGSE